MACVRQAAAGNLRSAESRVGPRHHIPILSRTWLGTVPEKVRNRVTNAPSITKCCDLPVLVPA